MTGLRKATQARGRGELAQRFCGEPFHDTISEIPPNVQSESKVSGGKDENPEKARGSQESSDLSGISEQISTSMKSMELQLCNGLGAFDARLKEVERAKSGDVRTAKSTTTTKSGTIDLRQGVAEPPPPETIEITEDPGDENEVGDDDENKEPPEGKSRVIVPDGTPDGKVVFLPTPYAEKLAKQHQGLRLLKQDVRPAEVGINPYEKKTVLRRTGRMVIEITPKREIRS